MDARCKSPRNAGTHCIRNAQVRNSSSRSTLSKNDRNRPGYCSGCQPKNWNLHFVAVSSKKLQSETEPFWRNIRTSRCTHEKTTLVVSCPRVLVVQKRMGTDQSAKMWTQIIRSGCPSAADNPRNAISQPVRRFWRPILTQGGPSKITRLEIASKALGQVQSETRANLEEAFKNLLQSAAHLLGKRKLFGSSQNGVFSKIHWRRSVHEPSLLQWGNGWTGAIRSRKLKKLSTKV